MDRPEIPITHLQTMEQVWKYASDEADALVECMRRDLAEREARTGIQSDSLTFSMAWGGAQQHSPTYLSMIAAAAFIKLARQPKAQDPLEELEKELKNQ